MCFNLLMLMEDSDAYVYQCHVQAKAGTSGIIYICIAFIVLSDHLLVSEMYC
jgi:hypothetical protein